MEKRLHVSLLLFLTFVLFGCEDFKYLDEPSFVYAIENENITHSDMVTLVNRLSEYPASMFSKLELAQGKKEIIFHNGKPSDEIINYFSSKPGKLIIGGESRFDRWILNKHVRNVSVSGPVDNATIDFRLTDEGAQIMASKSLQNINQNIFIRVDDEIIAAPYISQQLGKSFRITTNEKNGKELLRLSVLLKYGNLRNPIVLRRIN